MDPSEKLEFSIKLMPLNPIQNLCPKKPSLQIYMNFSYQVKYFHKRADGRVSSRPLTEGPPLNNSFFMDFNLFSNNEALSNFLVPKFTCLGIWSRIQTTLISELKQEILKFTTEDMRKVKVMPLEINVVLSNECELPNFDIIRSISMLQSELELERRNYGMVPTAPEVRKLKRIRVVGDDDDETGRKKKRKLGSDHGEIVCTVCMENIEDFCDNMPCGHSFHGNCIGKWLEISHYCPVCRFELPTESDL